MGKLITLVLAVLLIGGGWYYWQNRTEPLSTENTGGAAGTYEAGSPDAGTSDTPGEIPSVPSSPSATLSKVIISMTETGFEPKTVTVKRGQTVEFVNNASSNRWPASDLHPTHDIYPEFDPKKPVAPGETWSFAFDKTGTWNMHDHLRASFRGTITVTE